jgi:hypothetical protein
MLLALPAAAMAAAESIDSIEARLDAAEAVRAVKRLQNAYGHYLQAGRWNDAAALFSAGASVEFPDGKAQGPVAIGRLFMQRAGRSAPGLAPGQLNAHLQLQPIVNVSADGGTVLATWHEFWMAGQYGKSASSGGGVYENEYRRENGVWRISRMRYFMQYAGDYDTQGHQAPASWNIPYHYEAMHVGASVPAHLAVAPQHRCAEVNGAAITSVDCAAVDAARRAQAAARIARLQDESDVQNLQHAFGYYLDRKLYDDVADLFAAHGTMKFGDAASATGARAIKAQLVKQFGVAPLQRGELFDHILTGTVVTVQADGRTATARTTQLAQLGKMGDFAAWELGEFQNRFVKEGGTWKLQEVRYQPTLHSDFDLGWARDWRPKAGALPMALGFPAPQDESPPHGWVFRSGPDAVSAAAVKAAPDLAALALGLQRVIAVDAVENLNSNYGYTIDESDWDGMADAYSATVGAKELTGVGVYVGRERIRKALKLRGPNGGRSPTTFTIHQLTQPVTTVSADGMSAKQRLRLFQDGGAANGSSGSWIGGIYEETAVFEDGEWKLGTQDLHHLFNASYRNGWARVGGVTRLKSQGDAPAPAPVSARPAASAPRAATAVPAAPAGRDVPGGGLTEGLGGMRPGNSYAKDFPPDRQIRARQYAFPDIVEVGFHYVNPVSGRPPAVLVNP